MIKPVSAGKAKKNAWVGDHLGARAPNAPKSAALREFRFTDMFDKKQLAKIKKDAARGPLGTQLGSFKDVLDKAEKTAKAFDAFQKNEKLDRGFFSKDSLVSPAELTQQFDRLIAESQAWLDAFNEEGEREKLGKLSDRSAAPDKHREAKIQACKELIAGARISIAQIKCADLEKTKPHFPEALAYLETFKLDIAKGKTDRKTVTACRFADANVLQQVCGTEPAGGGTSEVGLIKAPDGQVAYAFKSITGEAPSMGMPPGAGAIRELFTSRLCEQIKNGPSKLDFGWPGTSIATLDGLDGKSKKGVLIDGLNGRKIYDADALSSITDTGKLARRKKQSAELLKDLPPTEIQKILLCNLAFVQFDIKWDNAIIEETPDGLQARPYDGGAALPTEDVFMDIALFRPGTKGLNLLKDLENKELPAANLPMDPALKKSFASIDEDGFIDAAKLAMVEASEHGLDPATLGAVEGCKLSLESIRGIKAILAADKSDTMTLKQFLDACEAQVFGPMAAKKKKEWLDGKLNAYAELQRKHPTLLRDVGDFDTPGNIWLNFMKPDQRRCFDAIVKLGGDSLKQYGIIFPIAVYGSPMSTLGVIRNKLPPDLVKAHPDIWPPKQ
jgi:hypothetical protein